MQDLFGGGVRRPVAKEALALGKRSRVGKAQAQVKPIKFKLLVPGTVASISKSELLHCTRYASESTVYSIVSGDCAVVYSSQFLQQSESEYSN